MRFNAPAAGVRGFTLIEALIVMVVLAIVAAVGIPNYSRYVMRGQLVEATNSLGEYRVRMDSSNRSYQNVGGACGAALPANLTNFTVTCTIAAAGQAHTATATGANTTAGFVYDVNQANVRTSPRTRRRSPNARTTLPAGRGGSGRVSCRCVAVERRAIPSSTSNRSE